MIGMAVGGRRGCGRGRISAGPASKGSLITLTFSSIKSVMEKGPARSSESNLLDLLKLDDRPLRLLDALPQQDVVHAMAVLLLRLGSLSDFLDEGVLCLPDRLDFLHEVLVLDPAVRGFARDSRRVLGRTLGVQVLDRVFQLREALGDVHVEIRLDLFDVLHVVLRGLEVLGELHEDVLHLDGETCEFRVVDADGLLGAPLEVLLEDVLELVCLALQPALELGPPHDILRGLIQLLARGAMFE